MVMSLALFITEKLSVLYCSKKSLITKICNTGSHKIQILNFGMQYWASMLLNKLVLPLTVGNKVTFLSKNKSVLFLIETWTETINRLFKLSKLHSRLYIYFYTTMSTSLLLICRLSFFSNDSPNHTIFVMTIWHYLFPK